MTISTRELSRAALFTALMCALTIVVRIVPVSYTHLDVYKRQPIAERPGSTGC